MTTENAEVPNPGRVMPLPKTTTRPASPVPFTRRPGGLQVLRRPFHRQRIPRPGYVAGPYIAADCAAAAVAATALGGTLRAALTLGPLLLTLVALNARGGMYRPGLSASALDGAPRLLWHGAIAWCVTSAVLVGVLPAAQPRGGLLFAAVATHGLLACAGRGAVHHLVRRRRRRRPYSALVVGADQAARNVFAVLHEHPEYGMRPVGLVGASDAGSGPALSELSAPVLVSPEDVTRAVIQNAVRSVVFTRGPWGDPKTAELMRLFWDAGCTVWLVNGDPAGHAGLPRPEGPDHLWGFACRRLDAPPRRRPGILGKRVLDIAVAALALLAAAPVLLACALAVRLADGPGVIFRQERIGLAGRPFVVLKFRTLRPADEHESATLWNVASDRRMSTVGHLLRRSSLDELPQLWNVLRGDMSLVGPRPERPFFVRQFSQTHPGYGSRHRMPVGITGLAQVNGLRGDTSIEDRARFDNHYIETWSLWQDVRILLHTAGSLFRFGGS
ncbi:exopolysaccharide biosynthesis polyprenyl glycosylphosphotransferase [Streptomyces sp. H27-D2]|uniref:exopolysaccharide biosynthesis polyprenyl glycosylphosphotransferase n=1 Tax=Streptomyces sp. H27-D2 TaxID=3046304 RepID=UPI002DB8BF5F|nr:exopolysaccharide biosynthesis polyprenyl glycosylphosphotransferase [Streptomyces sp. H27-D2]MEC4019161.1 exopolysaccharide biosynthesis polyprenyl glycosylphosphotransferase [Streptomyces sp. H27-D2]